MKIPEVGMQVEYEMFPHLMLQELEYIECVGVCMLNTQVNEINILV